MSININKTIFDNLNLNYLLQKHPDIKGNEVLHTAITLLQEEVAVSSNSYHALEKIQAYCENKLNNRISKLYWFFVRANSSQFALNSVKENIGNFFKENQKTDLIDISTSQAAWTRFTLQFEDIFKKSLKS